jgi:hypothetical protein
MDVQTKDPGKDGHGILINKTGLAVYNIKRRRSNFKFVFSLYSRNVGQFLINVDFPNIGVSV